MDIKEHIKRANELQAARSTWETTWQDIIDYTLPNRTPVLYDAFPGEDRSIEKYDSTAQESLLELAAAVNSLLTNQSSDWLSAEFDNIELMEIKEVKDWIEKSIRIIRKSLDNSNFYTQVHEFYIDLSSIGTATLYMEPSKDPDRDLNFSARHIREILIAENSEGRIDTVYRKFKYTVRQAYQKWGEKNSVFVKKSIKEKQFEKEVTILHCAYPRKEFDNNKKDSKNMIYASLWIDMEANHLIEESGFTEFPYAVARWLKSTGEIYGRSPALSSLADIKSLNQMMYTLLLSAEKIADPPYQYPDEGTDVSLDPGTANPVDPESQGKITPINIGQNLPINVDIIQMYRDSVKKAFFINQLHLIDNTGMTAEEVRTRTAENARTIGPTFGRLTSEFLPRLMNRVIDILGFEGQGGKLPMPPEIIRGLEIKLKYISPLAKQMRSNEIASINFTVNQASQLSQFDPSVIDNINLDKTFKALIDLSGTPTELLRTNAEIQTLRENRAKQQAQAQQVQFKAFEVEINKKIAEMQKDLALAQKHTAQAQKQG